MSDRIPDHLFVVVTDTDPAVRTFAREADAAQVARRQSRRGATTVWRVSTTDAQPMEVLEPQSARLAPKESR